MMKRAFPFSWESFLEKFSRKTRQEGAQRAGIYELKVRSETDTSQKTSKTHPQSKQNLEGSALTIVPAQPLLWVGRLMAWIAGAHWCSHISLGLVSRTVAMLVATKDLGAIIMPTVCPLWGNPDIESVERCDRAAGPSPLNSGWKTDLIRSWRSWVLWWHLLWVTPVVEQKLRVSRFPCFVGCCVEVEEECTWTCSRIKRFAKGLSFRLEISS